MAAFAHHPVVYQDPANPSMKGTISKDGVTLFYGETSPFSNFYHCHFVIDNHPFMCVEQYLLYKRAQVYGLVHLQHAALRSNSPLECKYMAKSMPREDMVTWRMIAEKVLYEGLQAKFGQDPFLRQLLLDTGTEVLGEANGHDHYWGTGLTMKHFYAFRPSQWQGQNRMGILLTRVRGELRKQVHLQCYKCKECNQRESQENRTESAFNALPGPPNRNATIGDNFTTFGDTQLGPK